MKKLLILLHALLLAQSLRAADPPLMGDCNGDRRLDVADAIFLLRYLFVGDVAGGSLDLCVGENGKLDISDAITLLSRLLLGVEPAPTVYSVFLEWESVNADQRGKPETVAGYRIWFLNGQQRNLAAEVRNCACATLEGLSNGVEYTIAVSAFDRSGNESSLSDTVSLIR